jgi:hypothetical protein
MTRPLIKAVWFSTPIYTCVCEFERGRATKCASVMRWAEGKSLYYLINYFTKRFGDEFQWAFLVGKEGE